MLRFSLVTPSLNQARYLEDALRSVLDQDDPAVEYVVADGGSTDGSVEIIERHADRLSVWWSEPDDGHADAVNKGFARTSGEIMGWLNSDDRLLPHSLELVREVFTRFPQVQWLTSAFPATLDEAGRAVRVGHTAGFARAAYRLGLNGVQPWSRLYFVQQESTFWRRELWDAAGGRLDPAFEPAADFELWARFFEHAELWTLDTTLGAFRVHDAQRTATQLDAYRRQAARALPASTGRSLLAARAISRLPVEVRRHTDVGWDAPAITWDHKSRDWRLERRPVP
ncbi:MAG TPA: glycosyltransferase family 2 protein [Gaiellaceae bacterium]|nr:glycosyltransferase family 2 protein [Gaiellaceae bacterium]